MPLFQKVGQSKVDRKDHCWRRRGTKYLCVFCGAVTASPPNYPTPDGWMPERFDKLTDEDRLACPRGLA